VALRRTLAEGASPPVPTIGRLRRLVDLLDAQRNPLFAPIALATLWPIQIAFAIEAWRSRHGAAVAGWLERLGELEALVALGTYTVEHPGDALPSLVEDAPLFHACAIGHPLLPVARCVRNDVTLDASAPVLVVSGSNMSGKSTLLRAVGVNAVLALAGAPVRAASLRISPLAIGASIRTLDSLREGTSRFYAEITRIRQLVDLAEGPRPLLFLLDEILHGTNSHDRRIGAEAIVRGLVRHGAIGLVTTHDLALAVIADDPTVRARNVHFADHIEDARMVFDYRMRDGIVTHSNALALMRAVGLEV
jgi:DNA mismatch repair ATPase MutS